MCKESIYLQSLYLACCATIELLAVSSAKAVFASLSDKHCAKLLLWLIYLDYYAHVLPAKAFE